MGRKQNKHKSIVLLAVLGLNIMMLAGCASYDNFSETFLVKDNPADVVRIGVFEPLSGKDEDAGRLEIAGIELAHKLYPTVLGKNVELVYADNKSEIAFAEAAARKLADKKVDIIIGSYGNVLSMTGGEIFHKARIPAIAVTCTNPLVTKGNPYYFRISIIDSFQAIMAAKYVFNELELPKTVILKKEEDDYGTALSQQFSDKLVSLAGTENAAPVVIEYKKGKDDYEKQFARIKDSGAEVVYLPCGADEGAKIIKQARQYELDVLFIGTDLWRGKGFIDAGGEAVEGVVFTDYFDAEYSVTQRTEEFLAAYREDYGENIPDSATALGFDAYLLALHAVEKQAEALNEAKRDPEGAKSITLRDVLAGIREFPGATGNITFDENGDPIKSVMLTTVENGVFKHKYTAEPEWN